LIFAIVRILPWGARRDGREAPNGRTDGNG
jgi:hypothetical protein